MTNRTPSSAAPVAADPAGPIGPAPFARRVLAQARFETSTLLRNGEQLLVALILPALALVGLALSQAPSLGPGERIDVAVPGVLALAVLSTAFTGQAISTGFDRRYGVLRLLGVSPLGRAGLLAGKGLAVLAVAVVQFVVLAGLGLALGWRPSLIGLPVATLFWLLGSWVFVALALLLAGALRAEAVLALANLVWVLLLALGGVLIPPQAMPAGLGTIAELLPSGALADGLRGALHLGHFDAGAALVLLAWGLLGTALALRYFRWSD
ncbi:ABC-2 type transport system permease protein [Kineosphaera limosa]|uniref:Putative ABC transporter permease protein n=1 Tax=Kineosphaera limosa NBRC 100340 TaxID=1184609 RepID=K6X6N3_9MICO|nr:ABC transporter permease [Kineosphaera limosa]NYE03137.1 ABC-2 type transport system permease protein [Kineosphaera limosa]GAB94474.1 putative ABC transporter permease protein [Kineosphaera limosa NBRC 100340]